MTATAKRRIDLRKYARLVARATPLVMETEAEYKRQMPRSAGYCAKATKICQWRRDACSIC